MTCCICRLDIPRGERVDALDPYTGKRADACRPCFDDAMVQADDARASADYHYDNR